MKISNHIAKSISSILLLVMVYQHLCSAMCAVGSSACCGKEDNDDDHCKKSCCTNEKDADGKKHDCQDMHFAFFNATGQFASEKTVEATKVFHTLVALVTPLYNVLPVSQNKDSIAYNGFHTPPPKAGIRIFIQSFQI
jgi:hypothetical protein